MGVLSVRAYLQLERSLLKRLSSTAEATLDAEFSRRRPFGATVLLRFGIDPIALGERTTLYDAFVGEMLADGLLSLFRKYPVLARLLAVVVDVWVDATTEFIERLAADYRCLATLARCQSADVLGPITRLACDLGDPHRGGRSVMSLTFRCGATVMYKPKPVGLEVAFTGLVTWINRQRTLLPLRAQRVLDCGNYGWVEHVEAWQNADRATTRRFYRRAGMLQCLLYAIGATDCHTENLIASGEQLVLIDMETLVQPHATSLGQDEGHLDSVLQTGLLPQWECQHNTQHAIDVSGLGALVGRVTPPQTRWRFVNTDAMHIARSEEVASPFANNLFDGQAGPLDTYGDEFVNGFEQMYRQLLKTRRLLLAPNGPLAAFRKREARFLFRATQTYVRISDAALTPQALRSGVNWSIELDHLAFAFLDAERKPIAWPILHAERRAMERLDVPYFSSITTESMLLGVHPPLRGYLRGSGYNETVARLSRFSETDLALQRGIIQAALHARVAQPHAVPLSSENVPPGSCSVWPPRASGPSPQGRSVPDSLMEGAVAIGQLLTERVITLSTDRINWLGLTYIRNNERLQVSLLSPNLYDGVCGVAVFLAALCRVTGIASFGKLALRALEPLRSSVRGSGHNGARRLIEQLGVGGTLGIGSVIYAWCKVSDFLNDGSLLDDAMAAARAIAPQHVRADIKFDVMGGASGAVLGLVALHQLTGELVPLRRALSFGHHLTSAQIPRGPCAGSWWQDGDHASRSGFAHGASGVAVALLRLHAITGDEILLRSAEQALAFDRIGLSSTKGRNDAKAKPTMVGWCHGAAGIGLACLSAFATIKSITLRQDAALALALTQRAVAEEPDHLCCGRMGRTETLLVGAAFFGQQNLIALAQESAAEMVSRATTNGGYRLQNARSFGRMIDNPTLFQGLSGIGYQLLRLAQPDLVPSLLLFQ